MTSLSLFDQPEGGSLFAWEEAKADSAGLRYYQRDAIDAVKAKWREGHFGKASDESTLALPLSVSTPLRKILIVLATGLGKTQCFSAVAKEWKDDCREFGLPANVLVLVHRDELVTQAVKRLEQMTGELVEVEKAERYASLRARIVVASIDSIKSKKRLERYPKDHFGLIIVDEAHHYIAKTYNRPFAYFDGAKVLGVTATPDRGDGKALGQLFDDVAYRMDIQDGVEEGFLVKPEAISVFLESIDLSRVSETKEGDLNAAELDEEMLKSGEGVCKELFRLFPTTSTILFTPGVKMAHYCANKLNEYRPGCAAAIDGETPKDERRRILKEFKDGEITFVTNCAVLTEGFDSPATVVCAIARPTGSRQLLAQMVGRVTRVLDGVIDDVQGKEMAELRRQLIALSGKTHCVWLDFMGNEGKHSLQCPEDILGGDYTEAEIKQAKKLRKETGETDVRKNLNHARAMLKALAANMDAHVKSKVTEFDPFDLIKAHPKQEERYAIAHGHKAMTQRQEDALRRIGLEPHEIRGMTFHSANVALQKNAERRKKNLATIKQLKHLKRFGIVDPNLTMKQANAAITYIASPAVRWQTKNVNPHILNKLIGGE